MDPRPIHSREKTYRTIVFLLLAVLLHGLFFILRFEPSYSPKPPVEIQMVDPKKLNAIKSQWQKKKLLLDPSSQPSEKVKPPKEARYFSNRNRIVQKEEKAANTDVIPKLGSLGNRSKKQTQQKRRENSNETKKVSKKSNQKKASPFQRDKVAPALQNLGVSFRLHQIGPSISSETSTASRENQGVNQALIERDLPVGAETVLNTQESVYYGFYSRLYEAIGPVWQRAIREVPYKRAVGSGEYTTVVDVILDQDGNLINVKELQSSGIMEFDQAVEQSWRRISKFPNPPKGLLTEEGLLHTGWTFNVQVGSGFNLTQPPARRY